MKKIILTLVITATFFISCSNDENNNIEAVVSKRIENLHAPAEGQGNYTGEFTKFSFKAGAKVTDDDWDIAFRATEIIVNGGEKGALLEDIDRTGDAALAIVTATFADVKEVPADAEFKQDTEEALALPKGSGNGWYTYDFDTHLISPIAGKIIVIKTIDGNYAKMEIFSYYKDENTTSETQYYTFNYVYNPNVGDKNF